MAWNPLLVAMRVHSPAPEPIRESIESMPLADAVHTRGGRLNVVIALQVRGDPNRVQIIGPPQVQDLLDDLVGSFLYSGACGWLRVLVDGCGCFWLLVGVAFETGEPGFAQLTLSVSSEIAGRSRDSKAVASHPNVASRLRALKDSLLASTFSLIFGHPDPLRHPLPSS